MTIDTARPRRFVPAPLSWIITWPGAIAPINDRMDRLADLNLPVCALQRIRAMAIGLVRSVPPASDLDLPPDDRRAIDFLDGCIAVCEITARSAQRLGQRSGADA